MKEFSFPTVKTVKTASAKNAINISMFMLEDSPSLNTISSYNYRESVTTIFLPHVNIYFCGKCRLVCMVDLYVAYVAHIFLSSLLFCAFLKPPIYFGLL